MKKLYPSDTAIDHIYSVYRMKKSNMQILNAMRKANMQKIDRLLVVQFIHFHFHFHGSGPGRGVVGGWLGTPAPMLVRVTHIL